MRSVNMAASAGSVLVVAFLAACGSSGSVGETPVASSNADLAALQVSEGDLEPGFAVGTTSYTVGPALLPASVTVTPTAQDAGATIRVSGTAVVSGSPSPAIGLGVGKTAVSVVVTAADGATTKAYTVTFHRTSAELAALSCSAGPLDATFSPGRDAYYIGPALLRSPVTVTPTAQDAHATIEVNDLPVDSGEPSASFGLDWGITVATVRVTAAGGVAQQTYALLFDRSFGNQRTYLKASNAEAGDNFGRSVAIAGERIVVGAPGEDGNANSGLDDNSSPDEGGAYVFARDGTTWTQESLIKDWQGGPRDYFGVSVAVSGDTIAMGTTEDYPSGSVSVFVREYGSWKREAGLSIPGTDPGDGFGGIVAMAGDTIVVGAPGEDSDGSGPDDDSAPNAGAAYVFVREDTTWTLQAYLKASNAEEGDAFGGSVAIAGDTIVVGASSEDSDGSGPNDNGAPASGAAYVFVREGATWTEQAYLKASNAESVDGFGASVAIDGDTLVAGATRESSDGSSESNNYYFSAGAAYVFVRDGTAWTQQAYLKASNAATFDEFGESVAIEGDVIVVGTEEEASDGSGPDDDSAPGAGAAYVFLRDGTSWTQQAYLKASNAEAQDHFGRCVAISNGTIVVGAFFEDGDGTTEDDNSAAEAGAVYVFR